jgi:uncharacterized protein with ATP-grasp and redox domains
MKFENIFTEFGKKLDEVVEKAPEIYKDSIEKPAKELLNEAKKTVSDLKEDLDRAVEEIKEEIRIPASVVDLSLEGFDMKDIDFEIDKKAKVVNIFFKLNDSIECSLIRQVYLPDSAEINKVTIELNEDKNLAIVTVPYKEGTKNSELIKVVYN